METVNRLKTKILTVVVPTTSLAADNNLSSARKSPISWVWTNRLMPPRKRNSEESQSLRRAPFSLRNLCWTSQQMISQLKKKRRMYPQWGKKLRRASCSPRAVSQSDLIILIKHFARLLHTSHIAPFSSLSRHFFNMKKTQQ